MDELDSYKALYISTAKTNIEAIKNSLGVLIGDMANLQATEEVFRNAHTLKSKSLMMNHKDIGDLAKSIEDTFYSVKNKTIILSQEMVTNLINQTMQIETLLSNI